MLNNFASTINDSTVILKEHEKNFTFKTEFEYFLFQLFTTNSCLEALNLINSTDYCWVSYISLKLLENFPICEYE